MENYLRMVFGRDYGYAYQYQGELYDTVDITVAFCNECDNHLLDTTVTRMNENNWIIWADHLLENNPKFSLIGELHPAPIEESEIIPDPTPESQGQ